MDRIMTEFFDLQARVEKFAQAAPTPRTQEEELKELRYLAQRVLARMAPAIEAYWLSLQTRESPWCPPGSLPHVRQVTTERNVWSKQCAILGHTSRPGWQCSGRQSGRSFDSGKHLRISGGE